MPRPPQRKSNLRKRLFSLVIAVALIIGSLLAVRSRAPKLVKPSVSPAPTATLVVHDDSEVFAAYGKSASCQRCHEQEFQLWQHSHHGLAERPIDPLLDSPAFQSQPKITHASQVSEARVHDGKFELVTRALEGQPKAFIPERVIGVEPLRQFMVPALGGRYQTTELAFDPAHTNWFDVYGDEDRQPGEWGHWTGRGMTWNTMCAACHNTRLRKHYQESTDTYATTMAEMSVGCESCHGPMAEHNAWQSKKLKGSDPTIHRFTRDQTFHACASCHSRRAELTGEFVPGKNFFDHYALSIPDETDLFYPDGQIRDEDYEFTAFLGSKMHAAGVRCIDCHEPHSGKTRLPGNALCMLCHAQSAIPSSLDVRNSSLRVVAPRIDPLIHGHHKSGSRGDSCVACHMPQTNYMQRHGRHDHGFTIPDPLLTKSAAIPNACARCHADRGIEWTISTVEKWYGPRMERPTRTRARTLAQAKLGDGKSVPELTYLLASETNFFWRAVAAGFLRRSASDSNVTAALISSAADPEPLVRAMSVRSLEPLSPFAIGPVQTTLQSRLRDPARAVRIDAAWALHAALDTNSMAGQDLLAYLRHSGDQPSGAMQFGVFLMDRGDVASGIKYLRRAIEWDANSAPPRHALAVALSLQGQTTEAVEQLQTACRLAPRDAEMQFKLGLALNEAGKPAAARAALEQAVKLDPQFSQAWYNLGLAYNAESQTDTALEALLRAESLDGNSPIIPYARATILARLGRLDEARAAARRALEIRQDYTDAAALLRELK